MFYLDTKYCQPSLFVVSFLFTIHVQKVKIICKVNFKFVFFILYKYTNVSEWKLALRFENCSFWILKSSCSQLQERYRRCHCSSVFLGKQRAERTAAPSFLAKSHECQKTIEFGAFWRYKIHSFFEFSKIIIENISWVTILIFSEVIKKSNIGFAVLCS